MSGISLDSIDASLHSIKISDGTNNLAIDASGFITSSINGSVTVSATSLDVRSLLFASDKVDVSGSSVTVSATNLDIRNLAPATDEVKIGDGTNTISVNADGSLNVLSSEGAYDSWKTSVVSATTTAGEIAATPLANRLRLMVQNLGTKDVFIGEDNLVTTSTGFKLPKGSSFELGFGAVSNIFAITSTGTSDLRISEFAS